MTIKDSNPKDSIGQAKWRVFTVVPITVMWELGLAMWEGAAKYGRHNYRVGGVRASVYVDAAMGHITQWWEGEDFDPDSGMSHITKAIASLVVLRDAMMQEATCRAGIFTDDRAPASDVAAIRAGLQLHMDHLQQQYPNPKPAFQQSQVVESTLD